MGKLSKPTPGPWRIGAPSVRHGVQIFKDINGLRPTSEVICTMPDRGNGIPYTGETLTRVFTQDADKAYDAIVKAGGNWGE